MQINEETGKPDLSAEDNAKRGSLIAGLRGLADWYESHPDIPAPYGMDAVLYPDTLPELQAIIRACGSLEKVGGESDDYLRMRKAFGNTVQFRVAIPKSQTCERKQVGVRTIPAKEAHTVEVPAEPEKVEPVYAWVCSDSILRAKGPNDADPATSSQPVEATEPATELAVAENQS